MFVPLSVLEFRDRAAMFFGDKIGVIDGDSQFTYRAFATRTHRLANALVELGVAPGDRVSFITFNTHHLLEAYYGVIEAGAVLNPINIRLAPHEIAYILDHAGSKVVFFHRDFAPLVEAHPPAAGEQADAGRPRRRARRAGRSRVRGAARLGVARSAPSRDRRERAGRALLHERHDRPAKGRGDDPPRAVPPRDGGPGRARLHRGRRRAPRRPAVPRQRLGRAALPDDDRRAATSCSADSIRRR